MTCTTCGGLVVYGDEPDEAKCVQCGKRTFANAKQEVAVTKLTKNQQATVVRLFALGTSVADLATSFQVPSDKIESIIRKAMTGQQEEFKP